NEKIRTNDLEGVPNLITLRAQQIGLRHGHAIQTRGARTIAAHSESIPRFEPFETGSVGIQNDASECTWIEFSPRRHSRHHIGVGKTAIGDKALLPIEPEMIAFSDEVSAGKEEVNARSRFAKCQARDMPTLGDWTQIVLFLIGGGLRCKYFGCD